MVAKWNSCLIKFLIILSTFAAQGFAGSLRSSTWYNAIFHQNRHKFLGVAHLNAFQELSPTYHSSYKDTNEYATSNFYSHAPSVSVPFRHDHKKNVHEFASPPSLSIGRSQRRRNKSSHYASETSEGQHLPTAGWAGDAISPLQPPQPSHVNQKFHAPVPSPAIVLTPYGMPTHAPSISPASSSFKGKRTSPSPSPFFVLPPPPPNKDCGSLMCAEPLTYTPPGSPCSCVWPIQVRLRLGVTLYAFFPLVAELAREIASSLFLNGSQVRIMGANEADEQLEKTIVIVNLVPQDERFSATSAFSIYQKFWKREVSMKASLFGAYEVVYVHYPGLPPSPPSVAVVIDNQPHPRGNHDGSAQKPLGVDLPRTGKSGIGKNMIIVIALSSFATFIVVMGFLWLLFSMTRCHTDMLGHPSPALVLSDPKEPGTAGTLIGSRPSSAGLSFSSSLLAYTVSAKIFNLTDMERATDFFSSSKILGEGGFGRVYSGVLDDGRKVAVKVLKRDDRQGSREFLAEVEMLGRLHHRNLVKLIGICTEDHCRCLVYELVPNGSVESHLHGADKEASPLDWHSRMKIALGAARGLAYLHEDSNPCVIHRDFKSSNILLENDFTPKVSDFGLARTALDETHKHISTRVMGTFGYLAPEYAMTGHLLVKSDVYSYGVVLLELLTGRKPVDLSQPPGQENLVGWARPLLATREGLEAIIDPAFGFNIPFDSIAKVAAVASMCVQPEVSHRPFMGEVVQALKLISDEFEETRETTSRSCSQEEFFIDIESKQSIMTSELAETSTGHGNIPVYESTFDTKLPLSATDLKSVSADYTEQESDSFRIQFNSAPLGMGRKKNFWQRLKKLSGGSMSEHLQSWKL